MEENNQKDNLKLAAEKIAQEIIENADQNIAEGSADFDTKKFDEEINRRIKEEIDKNNEQREQKIKKFDEEKYEMNKRVILMDNTYDILENMKEMPISPQTKLHNIAISYNNAKSEIEGMLKRNGKDPFRSLIYDVSSWYLMELLESGMNVLNTYINTTNKIIRLLPPKEIKGKIESLEKYLKEYEDINSKIYDFSIEKNIIESFDVYKKRFEEAGKNGGYNLFWDTDVNEFIKECNTELKDLGLNVRIPNEKTKNNNVGKKL